MNIKVCGLKSEDNINALKQLDLDWMGFIFYEKSPRDVSEEAHLKTALLDENWQSDIKKVGVFVNMRIHDILHYVHDYHLDFVQLHGNERPEYCRELNNLWSMSSMRKAKIIKAFSIGAAEDFEHVQQYERHCAYFLFDTKGEAPGGNGVTFDWKLLDHYQGITPFLLSGGISEAEVPAIKKLTAPQLFGVDINSKFEQAPTIKDVKRIQHFIQMLKN
ncbi:MAG: phosphoribosylanthranilate isomerase [Bacteroidota bacterium]